MNMIKYLESLWATYPSATNIKSEFLRKNPYERKNYQITILDKNGNIIDTKTIETPSILDATEPAEPNSVLEIDGKTIHVHSWATHLEL